MRAALCFGFRIAVSISHSPSFADSASSLIELHLKEPAGLTGEEGHIVVDYFHGWFAALSEDDASSLSQTEPKQPAPSLSRGAPKKTKRKRVVIQKVLVEEALLSEREAQAFIFVVWVYFVILIPMVLALYFSVLSMESSYEELRERLEAMKAAVAERRGNSLLMGM